MRMARRGAAAPARLRALTPLRLAVLGAAAALVIALAVLLRPRPPASVPFARTTVAEEAEFLPLVYGEPLDGADALHLTRVRLPRRALASLGWTGQAEDGPPVEAEVLVGHDGLARGIRFVSADGGGR